MHPLPPAKFQNTTIERAHGQVLPGYSVTVVSIFLSNVGCTGFGPPATTGLTVMVSVSSWHCPHQALPIMCHLAQFFAQSEEPHSCRVLRRPILEVSLGRS
jgi:hypothetical protein